MSSAPTGVWDTPDVDDCCDGAPVEWADVTAPVDVWADPNQPIDLWPNPYTPAACGGVA